MNILLDDIKKYTTLVAEPKKKDNKIVNAMNFFNSSFLGILIASASVIGISVFVIAPIFGLKIASLTILISYVTLIISIFVNGVLLTHIDSKTPVNILARKIEKGIYKGSLSDIVDLNCKITKKVLNTEKEQLSQSIFDNKGIKGDIIVSLLNRIEHEKQKAEATNKNKEEREALIQAGTPVGSLLKEVSEI
jgi:K+-sensing histidine kinase KdpD